MNGTCSVCGATAPIETFLNDAWARKSLSLVITLPYGVAKNTLFYIGLFRNPAPNSRGITWARAYKLINELKALVEADFVEWSPGGPARPNSITAWSEALTRVIDHPPHRLPFKNHNYLRAIAHEIANALDKEKEYAKNKRVSTGQACKRRPESEPTPTKEGIKAFRKKLKKRMEKNHE